MGLIILCYVLGIAMLALGFTTGKSEGFTFGALLILCGLMWHYKEFMHRRNK